jgi:hypothetical protein
MISGRLKPCHFAAGCLNWDHTVRQFRPVAARCSYEARMRLDCGRRPFKQSDASLRGATRRDDRNSHVRNGDDRADLDPSRDETRRRGSRRRRQLSATSGAFRRGDPAWAVLAPILAQFRQQPALDRLQHCMPQLGPSRSASRRKPGPYGIRRRRSRSSAAAERHADGSVALKRARGRSLSCFQRRRPSKPIMSSGLSVAQSGKSLCSGRVAPRPPL